MSSVVSRIAHETCWKEPARAPRGPWWEWLRPGFHRNPEGFTLGWRDQLLVSSSAVVDVGLRTAASTLMGATAAPLAFSPSSYRDAFSDAPLYQRFLDEHRAAEFYPSPPTDLVFDERQPAGPHFSPEDGRCIDLAYNSPFLPLNPRLRARFVRHARNLRGRVRYWRHHGPARPTLVLFHGFLLDNFLVNQWLFQVPWFYEKLGLDVAVFTMPFHGARRGKGSLFSGHMLFAGGFSWINEAFRQLVFDFRALDRYLREVQGAPQVGVSGVSLGGYTSGLLAGLQQDLAFAIPNVPLVSIPDLVLEWNPVASAAKLGMRLSGRSLATLRRMTALHSPLSHDPLLPVERLMIIGGVGDRLAPPKHARLLWEHWSRPRIHWFPGNHLMHLDQGDYLRQIAGFLSDIEFLPASARRV